MSSSQWRDSVHDYFLFESEDEPMKVTEVQSLDGCDVSLVTAVDYIREEFHVIAVLDDSSSAVFLGTYTCPIKAVWHHLIFQEIMPKVASPVLPTMVNRFADMAQASFKDSWGKDREDEVHEELAKIMMAKMTGIRI